MLVVFRSFQNVNLVAYLLMIRLKLTLFRNALPLSRRHWCQSATIGRDAILWSRKHTLLLLVKKSISSSLELVRTLWVVVWGYVNTRSWAVIDNPGLSQLRPWWLQSGGFLMLSVLDIYYLEFFYREKFFSHGLFLFSFIIDSYIPLHSICWRTKTDPSSPTLNFVLFFKKTHLIYLAVLGLSCSTGDLLAEACGIQFPDQGWNSGAWSLSRWTREVPGFCILEPSH